MWKEWWRLSTVLRHDEREYHKMVKISNDAFVFFKEKLLLLHPQRGMIRKKIVKKEIT